MVTFMKYKDERRAAAPPTDAFSSLHKQGFRIMYHIMAGDVEEILEVLVSTTKQGPHRAGAFVDVSRLPLTSVVT